MQKPERQKLLFEWLLKGIGFFCVIVVLFFMEGELLFDGREGDIPLRPFIMKLVLLSFGILLFELSLRSKDRLRKAACRAKVCYLLLLILFIWLFLLPSGAKIPYQQDIIIKAQCKGNLRRLGISFQLYAQDNDGRYPATVDQFASLYPKYESSSKVFWCPGDFNNKHPGPDNITNAELDAPNSAQISYIYTPGLSQESDPNLVILKDNSPLNHLGVGVNALHVDGHVSFESVPGQSRDRVIRQNIVSYYLKYHIGKIIVLLLTVVATIHWIVLQSTRKQTDNSLASKP